MRHECPKVSIVIPVYKAEPYIERCVRTLFGQTLDYLEFIFVDDCSPDRSIEVMERVLDEYPARKSQVKVIQHEVNQGVSSARQHGVDAATGEYIIHCDPDDWVELNMYEVLYAEAKVKHADIVICDFYCHQNGRKTIESQKPEKLNSISVLEGISGRSFHKLHGSLCNKLISSACYTNAAFYTDISYCEDVAILFQILMSDQLMVYIPRPLYHYQTDTIGSLAKTITEQTLNEDLMLIAHFNRRAILTEWPQYRKCIWSMTTWIIFNRAYKYGDITDTNFRSTYLPFKIYVKYNRQIPLIIKRLLVYAMNGNLKKSRRLFKMLNTIRHTIKEIIRHI